MESFDALEFESAHALYDRAAVQGFFTAVANRNPVTALQHNSMVIGFAMLMDAISAPKQTAGSAPGTAAYATTSYSGEFEGYDKIPMVGFFPPPTDEDGLIHWLAIQNFLDRLGQPKAIATGVPVIPSPSSTLYEVQGSSSAAIIPLAEQSPNIVYVEDADTVTIAPTFYTAMYTYAQRRLRLANGSTAAADVIAGAAETYESAHVTALAVEAMSKRQKARRNAAIGLGAAVLVSVGVGYFL